MEARSHDRKVFFFGYKKLKLEETSVLKKKRKVLRLE